MTTYTLRIRYEGTTTFRFVNRFIFESCAIISANKLCLPGDEYSITLGRITA